jgi:hypothetical protein
MKTTTACFLSNLKAVLWARLWPRDALPKALRWLLARASRPAPAFDPSKRGIVAEIGSGFAANTVAHRRTCNTSCQVLQILLAI